MKAANRDGFTPLALACVNGDAGMIEALLKAGADANERLLNGETALMMASRTGSVAAMTVLLDHGADVNAKEALHGTTPLMWAAAEGHPDAVRLLIERRGGRRCPLESRLSVQGAGQCRRRRQIRRSAEVRRRQRCLRRGAETTGTRPCAGQPDSRRAELSPIGVAVG